MTEFERLRDAELDAMHDWVYGHRSSVNYTSDPAMVAINDTAEAIKHAVAAIAYAVAAATEKPEPPVNFDNVEPEDTGDPRRFSRPSKGH